MGTPYISEIRIMAFNFAPVGWALCNGQHLPINQYQALFRLIGTTYGGDGTQTFALPDLTGRVPMHMGAGYPQGAAGGEYAHTITMNEMPTHNHAMSARAAATFGTPTPAAGNTMQAAQQAGNPPHPVQIFGTTLGSGAMMTTTIGAYGGGQPHDNEQPFLVLNFCIALNGQPPTWA
jgi:microcystin-dependent protein